MKKYSAHFLHRTFKLDNLRCTIISSQLKKVTCFQIVKHKAIKSTAPTQYQQSTADYREERPEPDPHRLPLLQQFTLLTPEPLRTLAAVSCGANLVPRHPTWRVLVDAEPSVQAGRVQALVHVLAKSAVQGGYLTCTASGREMSSLVYKYDVAQSGH